MWNLIILVEINLLESEVAEYLMTLLFSQLKKKENLRPSLPFFPPPQFAFCLLGSWTSESNFRTDKILDFSSAHTRFFSSWVPCQTPYGVNKTRAAAGGGGGTNSQFTLKFHINNHIITNMSLSKQVSKHLRCSRHRMTVRKDLCLKTFRRTLQTCCH